MDNRYNQGAKGPAGLIVALIFHPTRPIDPEWSVAMMQLMLQLPVLTSVAILAVRDSGLTEAREKIIEQALSANARYILFIDDDTAPPSNAARRLMQILSGDTSIAVAGGIYFTKDDEPQPVIARKRGMGPEWNWKVGDIFDVEGMGTGCMMVKADIFRLIPKPWFVESEGGTRETGDLHFCRAILDAGFRIVADGGVLPLHIDVATGRKYGLPPDSFPAKAAEKLQSETVSV